MNTLNTYDFIPTFRKVKNKQEYRFSLAVMVNGKFKTRYHGKDVLSKLNNRLLDLAINLVSDMENLNLHEDLWCVRDHHISNMLNLLNGKKAFRNTKRLYHGDYIFSTFTIDNFIKWGSTKCIIH